MTEYRPDYVASPGDTLWEILSAHHLSKQEFADLLGMPIDYVNDLLNGMIVLSPELAQRLEAVLDGPSAAFWLQREQQYQRFLAQVTRSRYLSGDQ